MNSSSADTETAAAAESDAEPRPDPDAESDLKPDGESDLKPDAESDAESDPVAPAEPVERTAPGEKAAAAPVRRRLAAAALALILAGAGYEGWLLYVNHRESVAAAQALAAAEKYAVALTSVDPNGINEGFTAVLDGATGEFKRMYSEASEQLRQLLIDNKAAAHGTVIEAAVKSATKNRVEVMLFVDQSVSNASTREPQLDRSRIVMTMEKADGRWLASKVEMP